MSLTFGSLFSGIGGFDLGFERAGMSCKWQCEIDPKARAVLSKHWPGVPIIEDVRNVRRDTVSAVDVICGGFPCQDLSVAGKRAGLAGERSGLWHEFARIVEELKPRWVIVENVPGLLSSNRGADFAVVLRGLVERGYGVAWRVLDAQYFGVAQRRRRVFIVASLGDGRAAEILFESEGVRWNPPARREKGEGVAGTLDGKSASSNRGSQANETEFVVSPTLAFNIQHNDGGEHKRKDRPNGGMYVNETDTALMVGSTDMTAIAFGGNNTSGEIDVATAQNAHGGTGRIDFESETFVTGFKWNASGTARTMGETEDGSPTITGKQPGVVGGFGVRRLTPTECERLQGFPDGWTGDQADSARYRQLGNAVAVPCAEWIGRRIVEATR